MVSYTYPLTPPGTSPAKVTVRKQTSVGRGKSPYTMQGDAQVYDGQMIVLDIELPPQQEPDYYSAWDVFFMKMDGGRGTCLFGLPYRAAPRGIYDSGSDTPVIDSTASPAPNIEGDRTIVTTGWRNNGTGLLKAGDALQLGSSGTASIHQVLADVSSDGSGNATIDIWPRLRRTASNGAAITLSNPVGLFELASNTSQFSVEPANIFGFSFSLMESLR